MCARRRPAAVTVRDVATAAQVSPMTVSRVLNHADSVHPDTRQKVLDAIEILGYTPHPKVHIPTGNRTIAVVVPDIGNMFFNHIIQGIEQAADSRGYRLIVCNAHNDLVHEQRYLEDLHLRHVDGVIIAPCNDQSQPALQQFHQHGIPYVLIDREIPAFETDVIQADNVFAAQQLTNHLIRLGRRRIAFISGDSMVSTSRDRMFGYRLALDTAGIPFDSSLVYEEVMSDLPQGAESITKILARAELPDAIIAINSLTARSIFKTCQEHHVVIPDDIALVSFDEIDPTGLFPFFTVAVLPTAEMGHQAVNCLLQKITQTTPKPYCNIKLPTTFIQRISCGGGHTTATSAVAPTLRTEKQVY